MTGVNILLVDDNAENLMALDALLASPDHNVIQARSGEAALRWLLEEDFAVILLDVRMPNMDGFETAILIPRRGRSHNTPIIFLTASETNPLTLFTEFPLAPSNYL